MKNVQEGLRTSCRVMIAAAAVFSMVPAVHAAGVESTAPAKQPASIFTTTAVSSPTGNLSYGAMNYGVSSSSEEAKLDERASLGAAFDPGQPPPRRRTYGRPRYSDKWHNTDGSSKIAFEVGAGMAVPSGPTARYYTPSYKFSVGGGLNFNKAFGVLIQYDYDRLGLTGGNIANMYANYTSLPQYPTGYFDGLDANAHVWSITANPTISFQGSGRGGAYVVGGFGYARKVTNFTLPTSGTYCDYYYGYCYNYTSNQTFDQYSSGGLTISGGVGLTYKLSNFSSQRLFVEARYAWMNTDKTNKLFYPHNAEHTGYFPVMAGIRW